jgi:hypothetical protein
MVTKQHRWDRYELLATDYTALYTKQRQNNTKKVKTDCVREWERMSSFVIFFFDASGVNL